MFDCSEADARHCRGGFRRGTLSARADSVVDMNAFIGRKRELRLIEELLAAPDGPTAALITGVAGAGKSRLLAEIRQVATAREVLATTGFEAERQVPLAAASPLLRQLAQVPTRGGALDALLVGRRADQGEADLLDPLRIFEAGHRALAAAGPALLIIDDLQWVDELSRSLCHYLIRGAVETRHPLVILAASRPGLDAESLVDSLPADAVHHLPLGPLEPSEGFALVRMLDPDIDEAAAERLYSQAHGIPFWLEGLARYGRTPGGLRQVLTRRLRGAGTEAAIVLGVLALAGRPLRISDAAELLELPPERIAAAVTVLSERGLVSTEEGTVQPAHDLVRATAAAQIGDDLRSTIHARLAEGLERRARNDLHRLRLALDHRRAAGLPLAPLALRIVTAPDRRLLGADGLVTLGAIADAEDPHAADTIELHAAVAAFAQELGQHEEALARWSIVAVRGEEPRVRAAAMLAASRAAFALDRADEARELLARSRELGHADKVLEAEQATHDAAIALWLERRGSEARRLAAHAVGLAHRLRADGSRRRDAPALRRATLGALRVQYEAAMQEGDPRALLRAAEKREQVARGAGLEEALDAELALAVALRQNGRVRQALIHFRRVWEDAQRAVLPHLTIDAGFWLGRTLTLTGALMEAEGIVHQALDLVGRVGDVPRARHRVARVAAAIWFERGRTSEAVAILERELGGAANQHQRIVLHGDRAAWAARIDAEAASEVVARQLEAAEQSAAAVECPRCTAELLLMAGEALARIGNHEAAQGALRRRVGLINAPDELELVLLPHVEALALSSAGERVEGLEAAVRAADASPYRLPALWARLDLGQARAAIGDRQAVADLERVVAVANDTGATTVRELAARTLRSLGVRTWRRTATGSPLTSREEEVARLVAAGVTNREVAARLFVSPKTVERHLVNVFRKLDVRNRTELAARLADVDPKRTGFPR